MTNVMQNCKRNNNNDPVLRLSFFGSVLCWRMNAFRLNLYFSVTSTKAPNYVEATIELKEEMTGEIN